MAQSARCCDFLRITFVTQNTTGLRGPPLKTWFLKDKQGADVQMGVGENSLIGRYPSVDVKADIGTFRDVEKKWSWL